LKEEYADKNKGMRRRRRSKEERGQKKRDEDR